MLFQVHIYVMKDYFTIELASVQEQRVVKSY
jgi:hypothetical protein